MTVVLGLPIPSTDPVFLTLVGVHVLFGLAAVIAGATAMLSRKRRGRHSGLGTFYFWCLVGTSVTMSALAAVRWAEDYPLFVLGALAYGSALLGRAAARRHWKQWPRLHVAGMGASYIFLLTAFYVDNGKSLPLWNQLPEMAFWVLPALIGVPILVYVLSRHPFILRFGCITKGRPCELTAAATAET